MLPGIARRDTLDHLSGKPGAIFCLWGYSGGTKYIYADARAWETGPDASLDPLDQCHPIL